METPGGSARTLQMTLGMFYIYHVVYIIRYDGGGVIIPSKIYGQAKLKAFLNDLEIPANKIDTIITVVESWISYSLDLGHIDKDMVASLLLRYVGA